MMDIHEILTRLPHRYPFLLIDRVLELEKGVRIKALKNVTINEPQLFLQHGRVFGGNLFGNTVAHHGDEQVVVNLCWQCAGTGIQLIKNC